MARYREIRGVTLRLDPPASEPRYVRLSVVERLGLLRGRHNVREIRAEPRAKRPVGLGTGRLLSWRDVGRDQAEQAMEARLRTLEALGYVPAEGPVHSRGTWDWLRDLVDRGLRAGPDAPRGAAIGDALSDLGLRPDEVIRGVAEVLGLPPETVRDPVLPQVRDVDPGRLAVLLPQLVAHEDPAVQAVGQRWLALDGVLFGLPPAAVEGWLGTDSPIARALAPVLPRKGLALLGPDALRRLAASGGTQEIRDFAGEWTARLGGASPRPVA